MREELGLDIEVGRMLTVDWAPHPNEGDKLLFIFDGGKLTQAQLDAIRFEDAEIAEYRFVTVHELDELTIPRLARRLRATLHTHQINAASSYLEEGTPA